MQTESRRPKGPVSLIKGPRVLYSLLARILELKDYIGIQFPIGWKILVLENLMTQFISFPQGTCVAEYATDKTFTQSKIKLAAFACYYLFQVKINSPVEIEARNSNRRARAAEEVFISRLHTLWAILLKDFPACRNFKFSYRAGTSAKLGRESNLPPRRDFRGLPKQLTRKTLTLEAICSSMEKRKVNCHFIYQTKH